MRDPEPLADQPPARNPLEPASTFTPRMRPIRITVKPVVERTYIEGYPAQEQPPGRDTGPIIIPVFQSPARQEPERLIVMPPMQEQHYEPPRISPRTEKERNEPAPRTRHDPPSVNPVRRSPVEPVSGSGRSEVLPQPNKEIFNTPDNKKINEPLKFSPSEQAPQAEPRKKLQHKKRNPGRQRKYHQTIALLEDYASGDTNQFDRLDPQMQRYYRREYVEYFGRDSKRSSEQRLANRTKAARTKRESEKRRIAEISRNRTNTAV